MKKQILKIFLRINLLSSLTTFTLTLILVFIWQRTATRGEELRNCYMPFFTEILATLSALFISLSTISIFLNLHLKFRQTKMNVTLSFLVLPALISIILWLSLLQNGAKGTEAVLLIIAVYFPVWFFIVREYIKYSKTTI